VKATPPTSGGLIKSVERPSIQRFLRAVSRAPAIGAESG